MISQAQVNSGLALSSEYVQRTYYQHCRLCQLEVPALYCLCICDCAQHFPSVFHGLRERRDHVLARVHLGHLENARAGLADRCRERRTVAVAGEDSRDAQAVCRAEDGAKVLGVHNLYWVQRLMSIPNSNHMLVIRGPVAAVIGYQTEK